MRDNNGSTRGKPTPNFGLVILGFPNQQRSRLAIQGVRWIRVPQQLGQENLEDVDHVEHWRPSLVDDIQTHRA